MGVQATLCKPFQGLGGSLAGRRSFFILKESKQQYKRAHIGTQCANVTCLRQIFLVFLKTRVVPFGPRQLHLPLGLPLPFSWATIQGLRSCPLQKRTTAAIYSDPFWGLVRAAQFARSPARVRGSFSCTEQGDLMN